jgi:hypothetical protein
MKKFILAVFVFAVIVVSFSSCTKEEVKPKADGLGSGMRDKI